MEFMTAKEASIKWSLTPRRVQVLCAQKRIEGAWRLGNVWAIPKDAEKPKDERIRNRNTIDDREGDV